jgi:hypothetical protein
MYVLQFENVMSPIGSYLVRGPQLMTQFCKVLETSGVKALLEDVGHMGHVLEECIWPLIPPSFSASCLP